MMYHYIIIRGDLPAGTAAAQVVHAAGESAALSVLRLRGTEEPQGLPEGTHAVVLCVPGEEDLLRLAAKLEERGIAHVQIREPDAPYFGELLALGVVPLPRREVAPVLRHLPLFGRGRR
jgi:peptidyl-tRNA hydrolase